MRNNLNRSAIASILLISAAGMAGCRQDMHNQPKFIPQRGTTFYADGRSARPQVEETVARSQLHEDAYFYTGMQNGQEGAAMPFPVTMDVLARGQERYNVYCTPCHSRVGNGVGMIVSRGYAKAGNFHTARLQNAPLGHFFSVITNGYGAMPDYSAQLTPADRWAVVAYVKALQLSQNAQESDVAAGEHVQPLAEYTRAAGFDDPNFAAQWGLPPTAVSGTPNGENYVLPSGQGNHPGGARLPHPSQPLGVADPTNGRSLGQTSSGYPETYRTPITPSEQQN